MTPKDTSLTPATVELRKMLIGQMPDANAVWDRDAESLGRLEFSAAPVVGDRVPNFRLPDARGGETELARLLADGPVVLVFYRGSWCPYCNLQLAAFQSALDDITAAGPRLVAISPQTPDTSLSHAERDRLKFAVLSDVGNKVARDYGLVLTQPETSTEEANKIGIDLPDFNGDDTYELPAAATFVISSGGTVQFASISGDYRWRVGPEEILAVLR